MTKEEAKQFLQQQLTQDGFIVSVLSRPEQQFPSNLFTTNLGRDYSWEEGRIWCRD
uniref:Uncharacterized protein n=1 Tax=Meloidogyne enterolobii TaxID=390850 RepID=A0A6V7V5C3_MELEN|nr:unnamed protein product [Meloidogyne enterolobii]